ncbi:iron-containing alcohol dehydrogenase [Rhizobium rhizoryzae]|uniref:Alcohol dehydrogenase 2 n=2 Tax=Rhizobium rhizoryzae TaxID=451876 RepID=A0A7W6LKM7_9HYPH|nr:alcohol dehydrogenase class IV [Rhizobium rhizoryzae]
MQDFLFNTTRSIQFGNGALQKLGDIVLATAKGPVFLITDSGMMKTGIISKAIDILNAAKIEFRLFADVEADPPEQVIEAATRLAHDGAVGCVIGLGGGSSLDVAKLVALLAGGQERLKDIYGVGKARGPRLPLILVPTTAGTGSEVTPISIVTTGTAEKMGVVSPVLLPDVALLDPELTYGLPPQVTAATGIDAMVHAIEAFASANANNNPISRGFALQALKLIGSALLTAVKDGTNSAARADMLLGSMLAGQAFANSPVAAVHALAYPLGGHFHIPHGLSNALVLPHVLRFNAVTAHELYVEPAVHAFPALASLEGQARVSAFCDALAQLSVDCGLPHRLRDVGITKDWIPRLARDAMNQTRLLVNNPRPITEEDALSIYHAAY